MIHFHINHWRGGHWRNDQGLGRPGGGRDGRNLKDDGQDGRTHPDGRMNRSDGGGSHRGDRR